MKNSLFILTLALIVSPLASAQGTPESENTRRDAPGQAEQQITQVNRDFDEAERRRDVAAIERVLADDFVWTTFGGTIFDRAGTGKHLRSGDSQYELYQSDDVRVRIYGETAVITARLTRRGRNSKRDLSGEFRYTRVYVKRSGSWQMVAYHVAQVGEPSVTTKPASATQPSAPAEPPPRTKAEEEIYAYREQMRRAFLKGDVATLERGLGADFMQITSWGELRTNRPMLQKLRNGELKVVSLDYEDRKLRVFGNAAVETGIVRMRTLNNGRETGGAPVRYTMVMVRSSDGWHSVSNQNSNIVQACSQHPNSGDASRENPEPEHPRVARDEVAEQTLRPLDERKADKQALLEQQDRNPKSEAEALRVIDAFSGANNRRDVEGLRNALNFPFVRIASGKVGVARTREEFTIQDWPPGAAAEGWHHSTVDSVQFIQSSSDKVHAIVIFSRYKADGTRYATYRTLRIITKQDGHWGIQCSSSFAP